MIKIHESIKVRLLEIGYPREKGSLVFDLIEKIIRQGAFYDSIVGGPESALIEGGSPDYTYRKFMIGEDYAEAFLSELADI